MYWVCKKMCTACPMYWFFLSVHNMSEVLVFFNVHMSDVLGFLINVHNMSDIVGFFLMCRTCMMYWGFLKMCTTCLMYWVFKKMCTTCLMYWFFKCAQHF